MQEIVFLSTNASDLTPGSLPCREERPQKDRTPQLKGSAIDLIGDPYG